MFLFKCSLIHHGSQRSLPLPHQCVCRHTRYEINVSPPEISIAKEGYKSER